MSHKPSMAFAALLSAFLATTARADVVLDWSATVRQIMQDNGQRPNHDANPGWSTRSIAMMNTAIYDAFQAVERTHQPFLYTDHALPDTSLDAAVHTAAYAVLKDCYPHHPEEILTLDTVYASRMSSIADGGAKTRGVELGLAIAQQCMDARLNDGASADKSAVYMAQDGVGKWRPQPGQSAWGPAWKGVATFGIGDTAPFLNSLPPLPDISTPDGDYTAAFNQVKNFGGADPGAYRTDHMTDTGLFWAYDRAVMGPPPVMFLRSMEAIADQIGTSPEDNARLFAMASVAQADAAIAAWDAKFENHFWRPIGAIQGDRLDGTKGHDDGNPTTVEDVNWTPLGAPGNLPGEITDDFTPPFPAWTSGHGTMGSAVFQTLANFFGNDFAAADAAHGSDPVPADGKYSLFSDEYDHLGNAGMTRSYEAFTQPLSEWGPGKEGQENTPESEIGMSRIYLGVHWWMDQRDGALLGRSIADYISQNYFQAVPEPSGVALALYALLGVGLFRRR